MKGKPPLWLICDVPVWLRLHIALGLLAMAVRRFLPKRRPPTPEGIVWIASWQAGCEALLRWVITRQAFRLCGLDPKLARSLAIGEAQTSRAWTARGRTFLRMYSNMNALARRWARRIRRAMAARRSTVAASQRPLLLVVVMVFFFFRRAASGQRIRAPPGLRTTDQTGTSPPADAISENASSCPIPRISRLTLHESFSALCRESRLVAPVGVRESSLAARTEIPGTRPRKTGGRSNAKL